MNQSGIEGSVIYSSNFISFKMENDDSPWQGAGGSPSSKPKKLTERNETTASREDGSESIGIGYPVDEDKFKELKRRSKSKMEEGEEENRSYQYDDLDSEDEAL